MNRFMMMAVAVVMLAAGGHGAEREGAKVAPIDWPARAATVNVGMTRAEVEKILPIWNAPGPQPYNHVSGFSEIGSDTETTSYSVSEDWRVVAVYDISKGKFWRDKYRWGVLAKPIRVIRIMSTPVKIEKVEKPVPPKPTP
jgi:hypothetical protein